MGETSANWELERKGDLENPRCGLYYKEVV